MWIQGGHRDQTIIEMCSDTLLLGSIPVAQRPQDEREASVEKLDRFLSMTGLARLELKVALGAPNITGRAQN